jgi:transcription elongation GreA/GreB family factor
MNIKQELYDQCCTFVENKLVSIQKAILEIQEALTTETKSSAGDKHETGRAMLQLEREKIGQQLAETQKLKEILSKIDSSKVSHKVSLGSIVYTTQNKEFYAISASTPIAQLLLGKTVGDPVTFRTETFTIIQII